MKYIPPPWKAALTLGALGLILTGCVPGQNAAIRRESALAALREYCTNEAMQKGIPAGAQPAIDAYVADCIRKQK